MKFAMAFTASEAPPVSHVIQFNRHDNCQLVIRLNDSKTSPWLEPHNQMVSDDEPPT